MAEARYCLKCGGVLKENAKFCPSCGTAVKPVEQPVEPIDLDATVAQPMSAMPQQRPAAQPVPQYQYQQAPPPPRYAPARKKKPPVALILALSLVVVIAAGVAVVFLVTSAVSTLKSTAGADFYEIGGDKIPSVKYILGEERSVTGVNLSVSKGIEEKAITYSVSKNQSGDMSEYAAALTGSHGYFSLADYDFSGTAGTNFQFVADSSQDGYLVMVQIDYDASGYTIKIQRGKGELKYG